MKRIQLIYLFLLLIWPSVTYAQMNRAQMPVNNMDPSMRPASADSLNNEVEIISLPPSLYMWKINEKLGNIISVTTDTVHHQFQNSNLPEGMNGHYNYLGNLGSPRLSRIFFDRQPFTESLFLAPYDEFVTQPYQHFFTNSNIPYTNLSYYKAGGKMDGEERFKAYFSVNVNKRLAFGFNFDYLYGRGFYNYQSTAFFKSGLFGSYVDDKYQAHFVFNSFNMKMAENGGIEDDRYITSPDDMTVGSRGFNARDIPTNLTTAWNYNKHAYVYLTHRYNLGFYRDILEEGSDSIAVAPVNIPPVVPTDSIAAVAATDSTATILPSGPKVIGEEFVPVTSIIHTVKVDRSSHRFLSNNEPASFFPSYTYVNRNAKASKDTTTYVGVKNTLGIALLEGFNKYAKAGLTAYISHKVSKYKLMDYDSISPQISYTEHEVFVGGELSKREGTFLHYNATGEVGIAGKAISQFNLKGDIDLNFGLGKDTVNFYARGSITNTLPAFYMRHYHANHYWWDNDNMSNEFRTRIEGELNINRWGTNLKAGIENIKNYTYFNYQAKPTQFGDNLQVLSAQLNQKANLGIFHLDGEVAWQKSSNNNILPLPDLSVYGNLYIKTKLAKKVLSLELGADIRYFTKYYAPAYSPGIQQFHLQTNNVDERVMIGDYPIVNVYANFHLKQTRFFVMMTHVNQSSSGGNYFLAPHYPINHRLLRLGLSWNFYD